MNGLNSIKFAAFSEELQKIKESRVTGLGTTASRGGGYLRLAKRKAPSAAAQPTSIKSKRTGDVLPVGLFGKASTK